MSARILCIGRDVSLMESRCAVLKHNGYDAESANPQDGPDRLSAGGYDLVILSEKLAMENAAFRHFQSQPDALLINNFLFPSEMLHAVAEKLNKKQGSNP
jgi:hypothetical protein